MKTLHQHADDLVLTLGKRLHAMRESRGWTLDELAEQVELSKAYLSRLEAGERQPSIAVLSSLARAFGVSVATLFEQPDDPSECVIVRGGSALPEKANGLEFIPLSSSTKPFNLQPLAVTIPADRTGQETYQHDGEEWLYVTAGRVRLTLGKKIHELEAGDAVHFDARQPHRLDALNGHDAKILLVACPIPLTLNRRREATAVMAERFAG